MRNWTPLAAGLVLALVCAAALPPAARAASASTQEIEAKVALENSVERRLDAVLKKLLKSDDVVAIANVEVVGQTDAPTDVEIMPGVKVKETPGALAALELPSSLVRKISVTLFVDRGLPAPSVELARKTAKSLIGARPERGDSVSVQQMDFRGGAPAGSTQLVDKLATPRTALSLAWLIVAVGALLLLARRFLEPLLEILKDAAGNLKASAASRGLGAGEQAAQAAEIPEPEPAAAPVAVGQALSPDAPKRNVPFAFVQGRDLATLKLLLKGQTPRRAAIILHYLPPAMASQILAGLPAVARIELVSQMTEAALLDPAEVQRVEDEIKAKIDYMVGGEDKLTEILDQSDVIVQTELLSALRRKDPKLTARIEDRIVTLDDLGYLDEAGLALLCRQVPVRSMAAALKSSERLKAQVLPRLKTGFGEWLAQEVDLIPDMPEQTMQQELRKLLRVLSQLVRDGRVVLHKPWAAGTNGAGNGNGIANGIANGGGIAVPPPPPPLPQKKDA